jgi:hypothetical protein
MTGTDFFLKNHNYQTLTCHMSVLSCLQKNQSRSYLNHLVYLWQIHGHSADDADGRRAKFYPNSFELLSVGYLRQPMFRICRHIVKYVPNKQ